MITPDELLRWCDHADGVADDDLHYAQKATRYDWHMFYGGEPCELHAGSQQVAKVFDEVNAEGYSYDAIHLHRHQPQQVLTDVRTSKALVAAIRSVLVGHWKSDTQQHEIGDYHCATCVVPYPCPTVRQLCEAMNDVVSAWLEAA